MTIAGKNRPSRLTWLPAEPPVRTELTKAGRHSEHRFPTPSSKGGLWRKPAVLGV